MAGPKKSTHSVTKAGRYFMVDGKMQELKVGTRLTLSAKQAEKMAAFTSSLKDEVKTDMTDD